MKSENQKTHFLELPKSQRLELLRFFLQENPNKTLEIVEKDFWVCWVLKQLFEMPDRKNIAFKGGTSLSKVFNIIDRFSEDIDITIDYRDFDAFKALNLDGSQTMPMHFQSGREQRRFSQKLIDEVCAYSADLVLPYLQKRIKELPEYELFGVELCDQDQSIRFTYPSLGDEGSGYLRDHVLIEFGGRNVINPNSVKTVEPYLMAITDDIDFPTSLVTVLAAERTFWEKATLIHVECHRGVREGAQRLSRHWFDLMQLSNHEVGTIAMSDFNLLQDVIDLKSVFYNSGHANYDKCLSGDFILVPGKSCLNQLRNDYNKMLEANFMGNSSVTFDQILESTHKTQDLINEFVRKAGLS